MSLNRGEFFGINENWKGGEVLASPPIQQQGIDDLHSAYSYASGSIMMKDNGTTAFDNIDEKEKFRVQVPWDTTVHSLERNSIHLTLCQIRHISVGIKLSGWSNDTDNSGEYACCVGYPIEVSQVPVITINYSWQCQIYNLGLGTGSTYYAFMGVIHTDNITEIEYDSPNQFAIPTTDGIKSIIIPTHSVIANGSNGNWRPNLHILKTQVPSSLTSATRVFDINGSNHFVLSRELHKSYMILVHGVYVVLANNISNWRVDMLRGTIRWQASDAYNPVYTRPYRTVGY